MSGISVEHAKHLEDIGLGPIALVLVPGPVEAENQVPWGAVGINNLIRRRATDQGGFAPHVGRWANGMKTNTCSPTGFGHDESSYKDSIEKIKMVIYI